VRVLRVRQIAWASADTIYGNTILQKQFCDNSSNAATCSSNDYLASHDLNVPFSPET